MTFIRLEFRDGWQVPVNEKGEQDWLCPKCGHEHISCCGNSHFPCKEGPNYGGECKCDYLDSLGSSDYVWKYVQGINLNPCVPSSDVSLNLLDGRTDNKANP